MRVDGLSQMLQYDHFAKKKKKSKSTAREWRVDARMIKGGLALVLSPGRR